MTDPNKLLKNKFNRSGFIPVDPDVAKKLCPDREHNPPSHLAIPSDKVYKHVCPTCKNVVFLLPNDDSDCFKLKFMDVWVTPDDLNK